MKDHAPQTLQCKQLFEGPDLGLNFAKELGGLTCGEGFNLRQAGFFFLFIRRLGWDVTKGEL